MDKFIGKIIIDGKQYDCAVVDGTPFIDGKPVDEFMETMSPMALAKFAVVGKQAIQDALNGEKKRKYADIYKELRQIDEN